MDHVQGGQQPRELRIAIKQCARQRIAGQPRTIEFPIEPLLDLLQLLLEDLAQLRVRVELLA
ncbi:hypothetical protein D3C79_1042340 [compost metagenome]